MVAYISSRVMIKMTFFSQFPFLRPIDILTGPSMAI